MKEAVERVIKALVEKTDEVEVREKAGERATVFEVRVAESETGRIIGREGRTIKAIRSMLYAAGQKHRKRFVLEIVE